MKLTKKHWMIIGVVVAIILVWWFFLRKKKAAESNYRMIRRRRVVGALSPELLPIEPASNVYTTKLDFLSAATPKCPPGCKFIPESGAGCVCPEDLKSTTLSL